MLPGGTAWWKVVLYYLTVWPPVDMVVALSTHNVLKRLPKRAPHMSALGFLPIKKESAIGFSLFFSRRLLLKQKKKNAEGTLRNPDFQVARRGLPAQTRMSTLFAGFAFDKMDFSDGFADYSWRAYGTRPGMWKSACPNSFFFILCSLALFLIKCGFLWMKSSVLFLHVANPCSWMWSTKLWPKTAVCFSYRVRSSVGSMCWDVLVCHSLLFMHVAQLCCWRSSLHIALFEMKFFLHRFLSCISFIFYWNIPRFTHFDLC